MSSQRPFDFSSATAHYHNLSNRHPFTGGIGKHEAGSVYRYDMHYGLELGIVLNGEMEIIYPDFKQKLFPGNIWFCGMWEPHGWAAGRAPYSEVNVIMWPPALVSLRFDETAQFNWLAPFTVAPRQRPQTSAKSRPAMHALGLKINRCLKKQKDRTWLWLRLFIMEAILLATDHWPEEMLNNPPVLSGSAAQLNQVLQRVFEKRGALTTVAAAGICGLNRNAFSLMFLRLMGLPFADFTLRYRLDAAASGLRQTDESVKSIALYWGFADTSHFDRMFCKHYGCTPCEYRRKQMRH